MTCEEVREYLYVFLDNELDAALSIEFQRHLERCGRCASEVEIERTIRRSLAAQFDDVDMPPLPEPAQFLQPFRADCVPRQRSLSFFRLHRRALVLTTLVAMLVFGAVAWLLPRTGAAGPTDLSFADLVVADFRHFLSEDRPVQFASADSAAVGGWLRAKTGLSVSMPPASSEGCRLIGARKCNIAGRTAAFAMNRIGGVPASLVATNAAGLEMSGMARVKLGGRTHWVDRCKGHTVVACRRGDLVYAAVSTLPQEKLLCLMADATYEGH